MLGTEVRDTAYGLGDDCQKHVPQLQQHDDSQHSRCGDEDRGRRLQELRQAGGRHAAQRFGGTGNERV